MREKKEKLKLTKEVYDQNEINSNVELAKGCGVTGVVLLLVWILYITGVFSVSSGTLLLINIIFPIVITILESALIYLKFNLIKKPGFKYFLIIQFIVVTFILNVIIPKHAILMWAVCIILVSHYFNPKISLFTYIVASIFMLVGIYLGMLFGEWDSNLLNGNGWIVIPSSEAFHTDDSTFAQRIKWLDYLMANGDNRYLKAFLYYYLPRWLTFSLISVISYAVSKRALRVLLAENQLFKDSEKIHSELSVATSIQNSVLPKELEGSEKNNVFGLMNAAKEIGGDFYDYFYIDDHHLALVVGDVSGKGIPAALFMMKTETLVKSLTLTIGSNTALIMKRCNERLCDNNDANIFVTCWLGIVNLETGHLKYTNAGHNKIIIQKNGEPEFLKSDTGVALGVFPTSKYTENDIVLNDLDRLLLYTDGVTEAHNLDNKLYGEKRLLKYSIINKRSSTKEFVYNLVDDINKYSNGAEQFDDITILMYQFVKGDFTLETRSFSADVKELDNLFEYSSSLLKIMNFSNKDIIMINTALEEVFVNVAKYAYNDSGVVEITLSRTRDKITFVFKDSGKKFNPLEKEDPNITASSEEREIGGLGIFMVKKIMDEVKYEYIDNQNVLTLIKYKK